MDSILAILYKRLDEWGINYMTYEHAPAHKVSDAQEIIAGLPEHGPCKNLFLRDKKYRFYLVVALFETKIALKKLAKVLDAPELRFAGPDQLHELLGVIPGAVTPFGLINDCEHQVTVVLDKQLFSHVYVGVHPLINTATTLLTPHDLRLFVESCGNRVIVVDFEDLLVK